jgi:TPR repeat protein
LNDAILAYEYQQYDSALGEFSYLNDEGNPIAAYYMGQMYYLGQGVSQDINMAKMLYENAASVYYFPAMAQLGKILIDEGQYETAIPLLRQSALAGQMESVYILAEIYDKGIFFQKNPNKAFDYYKMAALGGDMKAQYQIGKMYLAGVGTPQDYANAIKWLSRSANQGYLLAQIDLAELYANDKFLKNISNAYAWYSIIAAFNFDEIGQKASMKRDLLLKDNKLKKNLAKIQEAIGNWKAKKPQESVPAEEKNQTQGATIDGFNDPKTLQEIIYKEGFLPRDGSQFGVSTQMVDNAIANQNVQELVEQIEKAQKGGKKEAFGYLGDLFKTRLNNMTEAFLWYKKGAEAGDVYSQYQLAHMSCEGLGISQPDAVGCYAWLKQVVLDKNPIYNSLAQNALSIVRSQATAQEIEQGEDLFKKIAKENYSENKKDKEKGITLF